MKEARSRKTGAAWLHTQVKPIEVVLTEAQGRMVDSRSWKGKTEGGMEEVD